MCSARPASSFSFLLVNAALLGCLVAGSILDVKARRCSWRRRGIMIGLLSERRCGLPYNAHPASCTPSCLQFNASASDVGAAIGLGG